jgi:predicted amidohydrolase
MQALLAQLASTTGDPGANAEKAVATLRVRPEVDLAVFPELFLSAYVTAGLDRAARALDSAELRAVAGAAREMSTAVVIGFAEEVPGGVANAVACFDRDGSLAGVYRKTQLFGAERQAFVPGSEFVLVELDGTRVAPLICFDVEFPEVARRLAQSGAELLVTASANMEPFYTDHEVATRARALENRLPHVYANAVGATEGYRFVGGSRSVDADGNVLAEAAHDREELLVAPVGESGTADERVDYLRYVPEPLDVVGP